MANRDKAVRMAARGATPQQIRQTAGVTGEAARNIVNRATPAAPVTQQPQPYVSPYRNQQPSNLSNLQYGPTIARLQEFNYGGTGFGSAALQRARAAGMSDSDIKTGLTAGGYIIGQQAFDDAFSKGGMAGLGRPIRRHDGTVSHVTGRGTENWTADTLYHMQERKDLLNSLGIHRGSPDYVQRAEAAFAARGWQPSNSFASQGDLRMYTPYQPLSAPSSAPQPASQATSPQSSTKRIDPRKLGQVLKIAGDVGGIGKRELTSILETGGKNVSGGQVVKQLDKINDKLAAKGMTGINLKSAAANYLTSQAEKQGPGMGNFLGLGESTFGTGKIGKALQSMVGTRATGGYINPQSGQQFMTPSTARTILPRGMDLRPSGGQTVRGIGKQYEVPSHLMSSGTVTGDGTQSEVTSPTEATGPQMAAALPPEEEKVPQFGASLSEALANWATGFKTARSSRKRAGRGAQTLSGSTRVNPIGAFRGGM